MAEGYRTVEVPDDGNFWLVLPGGSIVQRPQRTVIVCGSCGVGYYEDEMVVTDEGGEVVGWAFPCGHVRGEAEVLDANEEGKDARSDPEAVPPEAT